LVEQTIASFRERPVERMLVYGAILRDLIE
jgi:hypothetical protein